MSPARTDSRTADSAVSFAKESGGHETLSVLIIFSEKGSSDHFST